VTRNRQQLSEKLAADCLDVSNRCLRNWPIGKSAIIVEQINRDPTPLKMPTLQNPRQERFVQELAAGHSAAEAYERAGYKPNYGNCIRLKGNERVAARLDEILQESTKKIVQHVEYTRDALLSDLEEARQLALKRGQASAAVQCTMGMAKILGLIIDRRENGDVGAFDKMTDEELLEAVRKSAEELGLDTPDNLLQFRKPADKMGYPP
jgi:hypothetical protein